MDFGLARPSIDGDTLTEMRPPVGDLGPGITAESMTKTGMVMGTPAYMDPQQLLGTTADARSDQYAFCVPRRGPMSRRTIGTSDTRESRSRVSFSSGPVMLTLGLRVGTSWVG